MAMYKCPQCGAQLEITEEIDSFFCTYCGTKIYSNDDKRIEAQLKIKEMEHKEREQKNAQKFMLIYCAMFFLLLIVIVVVLAISDAHEKKYTNDTQITVTTEDPHAGEIKIDSENSFMKDLEYEDVVDDLKKKGFTNVKAVESDKKHGFLSEKGDVSKVTIDGKTDYDFDDYFSPDVEIIVYYLK